MGIKICTGCKEEKSIDEFGNKAQYKDGKNIYCKKCWSIFNKDYKKRKRQKVIKCRRGKSFKEKLIENRKLIAIWYQKNKKYRKKYLAEYHRKKRKERKVFCMLCDIDIPCLLEDHHIIPKSEGGNDSVKNKITLCANCHKLVHAELIALFN